MSLKLLISKKEFMIVINLGKNKLSWLALLKVYLFLAFTRKKFSLKSEKISCEALN